jgi:hypothetical protein
MRVCGSVCVVHVCVCVCSVVCMSGRVCVCVRVRVRSYAKILLYTTHSTVSAYVGILDDLEVTQSTRSKEDAPVWTRPVWMDRKLRCSAASTCAARCVL